MERPCGQVVENACQNRYPATKFAEKFQGL
jgi:hypothetical protein